MAALFGQPCLLRTPSRASLRWSSCSRQVSAPRSFPSCTLRLHVWYHVLQHTTPVDTKKTSTKEARPTFTEIKKFGNQHTELPSVECTLCQIINPARVGILVSHYCRCLVMWAENSLAWTPAHCFACLAGPARHRQKTQERRLAHRHMTHNSLYRALLNYRDKRRAPKYGPPQRGRLPSRTPGTWGFAGHVLRASARRTFRLPGCGGTGC